jgi:hypothetical protein
VIVGVNDDWSPVGDGLIGRCNEQQASGNREDRRLSGQHSDPLGGYVIVETFQAAPRNNSVAITGCLATPTVSFLPVAISCTPALLESWQSVIFAAPLTIPATFARGTSQPYRTSPAARCAPSFPTNCESSGIVVVSNNAANRAVSEGAAEAAGNARQNALYWRSTSVDTAELELSGEY